MRRIDRMTAEEAVNFVLEIYNSLCENCRAKTSCNSDKYCVEVAVSYLQENIALKKRSQTYDSMGKAFEDYNAMCNGMGNRCCDCKYDTSDHTTAGCFASWLDEEIEEE